MSINLFLKSLVVKARIIRPYIPLNPPLEEGSQFAFKGRVRVGMVIPCILPPFIKIK
jgi:hypothetical protein